VSVFTAIAATAAEKREICAGDKLVTPADVVMDRGFSVPGSPESVWPWLVQLGKQRAGWYLPRSVERLLPPGRRAARTIDHRWQQLGPATSSPTTAAVTKLLLSPRSTHPERSSTARAVAAQN